MVKVKECCCGCSLRTGSLILLWLVLVYQCINILLYSIILIEVEGLHNVPTKSEIKPRISIDLIISVIGVTVSILGIYGIQKDRRGYLSGGYYFFCYNAMSSLIQLVLYIVSPSLFDKLFAFGSMTATQTANLKFPIALAFLFITALLWYFALVLKSYRDDMLAKNKDDRFAKMPDLSAVGYRNAV